MKWNGRWGDRLASNASVETAVATTGRNQVSSYFFDSNHSMDAEVI